MNEIKFIKIFSRGIAIVIIVTGVFFSFLIALNNAPGFALLGSATALGAASLIVGLGEILIQLKRNNGLLSAINDKLSK